MIETVGVAISDEVEELLDRALVAELSVVGPKGVPIVHPMIPLYDGRFVYMTSSVLFSRKLERIKADPRVSVSITDEHALRGSNLAGAVIKGLARVIDDDLHDGWTRLLPLWKAKEPAVEEFLKKRYAMPLFWERAVIEITPTKVIAWKKD